MRDMRTFAADVPVAWCLLVCHAPAPCKTADQMDVLFRFGNPRNIVLDGVPITLRRREGGVGKCCPIYAQVCALQKRLNRPKFKVLFQVDNVRVQRTLIGRGVPSSTARGVKKCCSRQMVPFLMRPTLNYFRQLFVITRNATRSVGRLDTAPNILPPMFKWTIICIQSSRIFNRSGQSNLVKAASNQWGKSGPDFWCSCDPQESPSQTWPRSVLAVHLCFHSKPAWNRVTTDRQTSWSSIARVRISCIRCGLK